MGFSKAFAPLTVGGSLVLFTSAGGLNPLGIGVLAVALMFLALRVVNRMYLTAQKEQELEKIKCIDRRLEDAKRENEELQATRDFVNGQSEAIPEVRERVVVEFRGASQTEVVRRNDDFDPDSLPSSLSGSESNTDGKVSTAASARGTPFYGSCADLLVLAGPETEEQTNNSQKQTETILGNKQPKAPVNSAVDEKRTSRDSLSDEDVQKIDRKLKLDPVPGIIKRRNSYAGVKTDTDAEKDRLSGRQNSAPSLTDIPTLNPSNS
jgi:hypothetical protein